MAKGLAFQLDTTDDVTERVRRAIGQADVNAEGIQRLIAGIERAGHVVKAPFHLKDCWAHIGIPKLKLVIYTKEHLEYAKIAFEKRIWERNGWRLMAIARRQLHTMSDAAITEQFKMALVELGKRR